MLFCQKSYIIYYIYKSTKSVANVQCRRLLHLKWASAHFFFFFPLSFFFSLFLSLSPLPLFLPSAMVSKRCKSIWNLVIKHTHKKCRWVSSELRLSYVFFLKVQKKSYKNKKSYQRKRKKKKSWAEMRQKSYIPQHFSPFVFAFHFIVKKDMEWTLLLEKKKKKKLKRKVNFISFFPLALSFVF